MYLSAHVLLPLPATRILCLKQPSNCSRKQTEQKSAPTLVHTWQADHNHYLTFSLCISFGGAGCRNTVSLDCNLYVSRLELLPPTQLERKISRATKQLGRREKICLQSIDSLVLSHTIHGLYSDASFAILLPAALKSTSTSIPFSSICGYKACWDSSGCCRSKA